MNYLPQETKDNTPEANLSGYSMLADQIKQRLTDFLHFGFEVVDQIKCVSGTDEDPILLELKDSLNASKELILRGQDDLSKEDIINLCNRTRDLSKYLFQKGYELLDYAGDKTKELNADMVQKVPLYKLYRDIGMFFISTGLVLSLLIGSHEQPLENVIFEEAYGGNTFGPEMMSAIQRYFASNEFMKSVFGIERTGDTDFFVEYGRIMRQEGKWKYQFQVNGVDGNVELWPTALFNTEHSVPK